MLVRCYDRTGSVDWHKPYGVENSDKRQPKSKTQYAHETERVHPTLLTKIIVTDKPYSPAPADGAEEFICQFSLNAWGPTADIENARESVAQQAEDNNQNQVDASIRLQRGSDYHGIVRGH